MRYLLFCFVVLFAFAGCKKNKGINYTVTGTITYNASGTIKPSPGVKVELYQSVGGGDPKVVQTVTTGADGIYSFTIKREKIEKFWIKISKPNHFPNERSFTLEDLDSKKDNVIDISIVPKAWVRLIFKNTNPSESVAVTRGDGLHGCDECCTYTSFSLYGVTDTSFICLNESNTIYGFSWTYIGGTAYNDATVVTPPLDTVNLVLNF